MKLWALRICNIALYLATCALAGTGLLLEFRLEEDGAGVLGLSSDDWSEIHLVLAFVFLSLSIVHVLLNWNWVTALVNRTNRWGMIATGLIGVALMAGILLMPASNSQGSESEHQGHGRVEDDD